MQRLVVLISFAIAVPVLADDALLKGVYTVYFGMLKSS